MLFQVQLVNGQKQLVAISGSAAADTVQSGNLNPVTSNAVASAVGWSFTEQMVGVFDDGNTKTPLYRKMIKARIPSNGAYAVATGIANLKNIVSWRGNFYQGSFANPTWIMHVPYTLLEGTPITNWIMIYCYYNPNYNDFESTFTGGGAYATSYFDGEVIFFVEYTKTV